MSELRWESNIEKEAQYWEVVIQREIQSSSGIRKPRPLTPTYMRSLVYPSSAPPQLFRILDVGSGPFSTLGIPEAGSATELVAADALGEVYNALLEKYDVAEWPRVVPVRGEELSKHFESNYFDWVNAANALDHCANPLRVITEMVEVCKPGGVVAIISRENEGEREGYHGLHQWNIRGDGNRVLLWNRDFEGDLFEPVNTRGTWTWHYLDRVQLEFNVISVIFQKAVAATRTDQMSNGI